MSMPIGKHNKDDGFDPEQRSAPSAPQMQQVEEYISIPGQPTSGYTVEIRNPTFGEIYNSRLQVSSHGAQSPYAGTYNGQLPITQQPTFGAVGDGRGHPSRLQGYVTIPTGISNCPRGLEYLTTVDQLLVRQKVELLEAIVGFETNNKFVIKNALGQNIFYAVEDTDCCTRNMCGPERPFDLKVFDNYRNEVIHMYRPLACSSCCFPCCLQTIQVSSPPGNFIGNVDQEWSLCWPSYRINNHLGETVLRIEGPCCQIKCCNVTFKVLSLDGTKIGKITKQWSGLAREVFTDADFFGVTFPIDLDVRTKALLLGATFLIDAMFFEHSGTNKLDILQACLN